MFYKKKSFPSCPLHLLKTNSCLGKRIFSLRIEILLPSLMLVYVLSSFTTVFISLQLSRTWYFFSDKKRHKTWSPNYIVEGWVSILICPPISITIYFPLWDQFKSYAFFSIFDFIQEYGYKVQCFSWTASIIEIK